MAKELDSLLDAVEHILAGEPVSDLPRRIHKLEMLMMDSKFISRIPTIPIWEISDLICLSECENRVLLGETPCDVYKTNEYKPIQDLYRRHLKNILTKYK